MQTFTGYEPKNVPITMGPSGTFTIPTGSASSSAAGQIVPADTLDTDLGNLMDHSTISLEDFIDESIVPSGSVEKANATQDILPISSGPKGYASNLDAMIVPSQPKNQQKQNNLAQENANLRQELGAVNFQLNETKIVAGSYAQQVLQDSRLKAEQALAYQKGTFEKAHVEYSIAARDICQSEVAQSTANLESAATSVINEHNKQLQTASFLVENLKQHLTHAQKVAAQEAQDKQNVEHKAKAALDAQKASSSQQQSALRVSLVQTAQESHAKILKGREDEISRNGTPKTNSSC